MFKIKH